MLTFNGVVEGFVVNFLKKNFWRIQRSHEYEDALQEAALVFYETEKRYHESVDNDAWMMSLFKVSWINRFNDLAQAEHTRKKGPCMSELTDDDSTFLNTMLAADPTYAAVLLREVPEGVRQVLSIFAQAPAELQALAAAAWLAQGHNKVDGNAYLCRLVGMDPVKVNVVEMVSQYFSPAM